MSLCPLHVRSGYSLCRGPNPPAALVARAVRLGHDAMAVTDYNGLYGATVFWKAAIAAGVRPIVGAELHDGAMAAVALVIDRTGYENLCRILTRLHAGGTVAEAVGQLHHGLHAVTEDVDLAEMWLTGGVPAERVWLELDPPTQSRQAVRRLAESAGRLGIGLLATGKAMMATKADYETARLLAAIRLGRTISQVDRSELPPAAAVLRSSDELAAQLGDFPEALANNRLVADQCRYPLLPQSAVFPAYPCPAGQSARKHLRQLCLRGARGRYGWVNAAARQRLHHELNLIERKGFLEYFLVVRDIVQYARRQGAPIAGRGSGASSLVAYVLGITNVCPLSLDIPFERFLNERREDFPDLDIDFCWRIRDDVIDYAFERWGSDHVAMVCTHNTFKDRSAFRETAKAVGLSDAQVSDLLRGRGDARRARQIADRSQAICGLPHLLSVHPGGIVIGRKPIDHYAPIQMAAKGVRITQYDKRGVEDVGLVKLDLLGNRSLSTIHEACRWIEFEAKGDPSPELDVAGELIGESLEEPLLAPRTAGGRFADRLVTRVSDRPPAVQGASNDRTPSHPTRLDIEALPTDDDATYDLMCRGDTVGCNQLESPAMRHLLQCIRPRELRDIMKALALIRPGAASIGMKDAFIRRHRGIDPVPVGYAPVDEILAPTHGVMTYEDDVMLVAAAMTGCARAEADRFRKAVQKCHDDDQRERLSRDFLDRCDAHGVDLGYAADMWVQMAKFNAYSFCRAHAASYGRLAYAVAYLRTHHPAAFWTAALNNNQSMYHPRLYVRCARRGGVRFGGPDVNQSGEEFTLSDGTIRVGFNRIGGLGPVAIETIVEARRRRPFTGLTEFLDRTRLGAEEVRSLIGCGAMDALGPSRPALMMELKLFRPHRRGKSDQPNLLEANRSVGADLADYDEARKRRDEVGLLGMDLHAHPMESWRSRLAGPVDATSTELPLRIGCRVRIAGLLEAARTTRSQSGREMQFFSFDDEWGLFETTAFAGACRHLGQPVEGAAAIVTGTAEDHYGVVTVTAEQIQWHTHAGVEHAAEVLQ